MRIKVMECVLVAVFLLMTSAYAQEQPSADDIVSKMQTELNLDQVQVPKIRQIIQENLTKRKQTSPQSPQGLSQAQSQPLDLELYQKLSEVLTRSQMDQWNATRMFREMDVKPDSK